MSAEPVLLSIRLTRLRHPLIVITDRMALGRELAAGNSASAYALELLRSVDFKNAASRISVAERP